MACKVLFLDSSWPINTRSKRIIDSLNLNDYEVHVCTWDRSCISDEKIDNHSIYSTPNVGYGNKISKLFYIFKYASFIKKVISNQKPDFIIASHWDILFISIFFKGKSKLIYDNIDLPEFKISIIEIIILFFERLSLKKVDVSFLASRFYLPLYENNNCIIVENLPVSKEKISIYRSIESKIIKLGFVGSVRHYELLKNVILAVREYQFVEFHIYGDGIANEKLKKFCHQYDISNVVFHGRYNYEDIHNIYSNIDVLWAAYPYKSRNVKYAISNKFFESILYSIPCLYSINTKLGDYVRENEIGVTLDPYCVDSIKINLSYLLSNYKKIYSNLDVLNSTQNSTWDKNTDIINDVLKRLEND